MSLPSPAQSDLENKFENLEEGFMNQAKKITDSLADIISDFDNYTPTMVKGQLIQARSDVKKLESFWNDKKSLAEDYS